MKSALGGLEGEKQLLLTKWGGGGADEQLDPGGKGSVWWGRRAHSQRGKLTAQGAPGWRLPMGVLGCSLQTQTHFMSTLTTVCFPPLDRCKSSIFPLDSMKKYYSACVWNMIENNGGCGIRTLH